MLDCHIHIEGPYTAEWFDRFVQTAVERGIDEICLLEHCYRYREFLPMYENVRAYSAKNAAWLDRRAGVMDLAEYLRFVEEMRARSTPVKVRFGLEVCYFQGQEELVRRVTRDSGLDFLTGSVHFIDGFAYDTQPDYWDSMDVDTIYRRFFEQEIALADSGVFTGIGHPDCVKLFGHHASYPLETTYEALARALVRTGTYAEESGGIYLRGTCGAVLGMDPAMLRIFQREGVELRTASDAHHPEDVGANIATLEQMLGA